MREARALVARAAGALDSAVAAVDDLLDGARTRAAQDAPTAALLLFPALLVLGAFGLVPLGYGWVYRQEFLTLAEEIAAVQAVTHDHINELLQTHPLDRLTTLGLGPCEKIN